MSVAYSLKEAVVLFWLIFSNDSEMIAMNRFSMIIVVITVLSRKRI